MAKKMLIDATHAEETRVVVVDGNKVEEFDFESENKRQLAGNIYLAKVTRVEPSLQAAFVDYGGNRHGFLAFSEIHPDYYQIPVADREALMEEERAYAEAMRARDEEDEKPKPKRSRRSRTKTAEKPADAASAETDVVETEAPAGGEISGMETIDPGDEGADAPVEAAEVVEEEAPKPKKPRARRPRKKKEDAPAAEAPATETPAEEAPAENVAASEEATDAAPAEDASTDAPDAPKADDSDGDDKTMAMSTDSEGDAVATKDPETGTETEEDTAAPDASEDAPAEESSDEASQDEAAEDAQSDENASDDASDDEGDDEDGGTRKRSSRSRSRRKRAKASEKDASIEDVADDDDQEDIRPPRKPRPRRYKIQEVIKVRQILLVQVVKEERGNKGAALTTYLSLAGRYCVLMPNTARGGGISRKITNVADRKKLKEIAQEIDVPQGAGLIIRTAGAQRTKSEVKRDYEYLQRMWEQIRELTLKSIAPAKIYEEGDLIKRSIRDLYSREIDEVMVEGERGYRIAKDFMKMIMPSHAKNVKNYQDSLPLFARYQVESYLGGMFNPTVQLKSGGYIVIGVTEALVAVDVNSGRATKEGSIEETALKTNLEAAEEVARQLRLRDLAGLIVIDFIDMDERKNNNAVEKRLKDKLKTDRARIQVGRISGFGLLEMSRQRLRPGMIEATTQPCPHCHGTGLIRSDDNLALTILRQIEEEGTRRRSREVLVKAPVGIVNYIMNQKREHVAQIEARYGLSVRIEADPALISPDFTLEKLKTATRIVPEPTESVVSADASLMDQIDEDIEDAEIVDETQEDEEAKPKKRRRRRRRRKPKGEGAEGQSDAADASEDGDTGEDEVAGEDAGPTSDADAEAETESPKPKKSRSRSRKKPAAAPQEDAPADAPEAEAEVAAPVAEEASSEEASETVEETAVAEDVAVEAPEAATEAPVAEPEPQPEPEPVVEAAAEPAPEPEADKPAKPKRRGWWSMGR
ncbi:Rne/Rng family ribonuclease [Cognatishimia sp.]|uniref:Rne/Rng family ribonuclease n=1 Tax=Cognatishimia sp. TaxID=2211648 RepID=UPI0035168F8B